MIDNVATIVDWFGPYTGENKESLLRDARRAARDDYGSGLYAAVGHGLEPRRGPRTLLYMGVGNPLHSRLHLNHHVLGAVSITSLWLGEVSVAGVPGRREKSISPHLDLVEWASVYFLKIPHNERKSVNAPDKSCIVLNRWWGVDYESLADRPVARWADVIEFDKIKRTANLVWFGLNGRVKSRNNVV